MEVIQVVVVELIPQICFVVDAVDLIVLSVESPDGWVMLVGLHGEVHAGGWGSSRWVGGLWGLCWGVLAGREQWEGGLVDVGGFPARGRILKVRRARV